MRYKKERDTETERQREKRKRKEGRKQASKQKKKEERRKERKEKLYFPHSLVVFLGLPFLFHHILVLNVLIGIF